MTEANTSSMLALPPSVKIARNGLSIEGDMVEVDWIETGKILAKADAAMQWLIGDWWAYGEHKYGDRRALVESDDWEGPSFDTCAKAAKVARAFETCRRRQVLGFSHHDEVTALARSDPEKADQLLDQCERESLSTRELRSLVRDYRRNQRIGIVEDEDGEYQSAQDLTDLIDSEERFQTIYADPPWRYDHSLSNSREIENQYPTMSLEAICELRIAQIAAEDSVLFLWATSPKLSEALQVIAAWGFDYKTCAVWDKQKIGMGYYFRQQHELLLVATKGSPVTPESSVRRASVFSYPRGEHSKKPIEFYDLLEQMYPHHRKIELFCRAPRSGWHAWGNQVSGDSEAA